MLLEFSVMSENEAPPPPYLAVVATMYEKGVPKTVTATNFSEIIYEALPRQQYVEMDVLFEPEANSGAPRKQHETIGLPAARPGVARVRFPFARFVALELKGRYEFALLPGQGADLGGPTLSEGLND